MRQLSLFENQVPDVEPLLKAAINRAAKRCGLSREQIVDKMNEIAAMVAKGTYPARTDKIEARVLAVYGGATVTCPVLGGIDAAACAAHQDRAKRIGLRAGNPETLRLFKCCSNCPVRGAKQGE